MKETTEKVTHEIWDSESHVITKDDILGNWISVTAKECPVCRAVNLELALKGLLAGLALWVKAVDGKRNRRPAYLAILKAQKKALDVLRRAR
jgi:hypothetical protein